MTKWILTDKSIIHQENISLQRLIQFHSQSDLTRIYFQTLQYTITGCQCPTVLRLKRFNAYGGLKPILKNLPGI